MKVYVDLLFILNFLFDLILLSAVAVILRRNIGMKRLLLGSLLGASSLFILFLNINDLELLFLKIIISILMVLVTFKFDSLKYTIKNMLFLYIVSFVMGGALYALNLTFSYQHTGMIFFYSGISINWWFVAVMGPIMVYLFVKQGLELRNNYSNYYLVDLYLKDGRQFRVNGFLDTGNHLYDPYCKRPIVLVDAKALPIDLDQERLLLVPYQTLNHQGMLKCLVPEKVHIYGVGMKYNVIIGISDERIKIDGVNCIIHPALMEGRL